MFDIVDFDLRAHKGGRELYTYSATEADCSNIDVSSSYKVLFTSR